MRQIRSRMRAAVALSLAFVALWGEAEKLEDESNESAALYHVWFDAEGECELLPNDKSRVLNTQPVKEQKTKE